MEQSHTVLFLYIDGKIRVFCKKNDEIIPLREQGIEAFALDDKLIGGDFWTWWRRKAGFIEGDKTDFCFIYDTFDSRLLLDSTKDNKISPFWSVEGIRYLFEKCNIATILHSANDIQIPFGKDPKKSCFTNLEFSLGIKSDVASAPETSIKEVKKEQESQTKHTTETEMERLLKEMYENRPSNQSR